MLNINNTRQKINNNSLPCVHRRSSCLRSSLFFRLPIYPAFVVLRNLHFLDDNAGTGSRASMVLRPLSL